MYASSRGIPFVTIQSMQKTLCLIKPVGETPLQTILKFKSKNTEYKDQTLSYAGRLDPMAEGLLLVLVGVENKKRKDYEALEKTYIFSVLFGVTTDSYDLLGLPILKHKAPLGIAKIKKLQKNLPALLGKHIQSYPPFSSKTVNGKPLYYWAREGKLNEIKIPSKTINISSLKQQAQSSISSKELLARIKLVLPLIKGHFRQDKILTSWDILLTNNSDALFSLLTFSATCSSGTYVRAIARQMGDILGTGALAFSIKRTRIGDFTLENALT